jgi:hypothetical protein
VLAPHAARINHDETWLTLFDLYRAVGWQAKFESAAIDFAGRFGRSAPQWFSMPEIVAKMHTPAPAAATAGQDKADWTCPAVFGTQTAARPAALGRASEPYKLNWNKITSIAEGAVEPLTRLFTQWAGQSVQLRFIGAEALEKVLREATPSSDRAVNPAWWKLRMEVLRVTHRPDEFELVALDYCVTYEVSPPSWDSAKCGYKSLQPDGSLASRNTIVGEAFRDSVASSRCSSATRRCTTTARSSPASRPWSWARSWRRQGSAGCSMPSWPTPTSRHLVRPAMRIDFTAMGTLLNWVTAREVEGRQVQFSDVQAGGGVLQRHRHQQHARMRSERISCWLRASPQVQHGTVSRHDHRQRAAPGRRRPLAGGDQRRRPGDPGQHRRQGHRAQGAKLCTTGAGRFAGATTDAFTCSGASRASWRSTRALVRAAIELTRTGAPTALRRLEAMLAVADRESSLIITGNGDVLEPERGIIMISSGGGFARAGPKAPWQLGLAAGTSSRSRWRSRARSHLHQHEPHDQCSNEFHDAAGDRLRARSPHRGAA